MSRNLTTLLEQAALLRSCGASWESVGRKTGRRAGTCRSWPKRYADKWNPLYREASAARYEELGNEAEMTLRHLLRDDDKKWQIKSAEVLLRHRNIPAAITDNTFPNDGQERLTAVEWARKNHDKEMDGWRASRGLPPYQSHEERLGELKAFYDYLDKEELDYYRKVLEVKEPEPRPQPPLAEAMEVNTPSPTGSSIILPTLLALVGIAIGALLVERQSHVGLESPTYVGLSSPTPSHITLGTTPARLDSNSAARSTLPEPSAMPNTLQTGHSSFLQFTFAAALCGMMLDAPHAAEPAKEGKEKAKANRLAKESSPYLLQHAHNPVDWYPWGPEAFEKAKKDKKLVFLSIGYSSCHWCHVMEKESFSNKDVADYLNANFVCIKVDREERPDIDEIYMTALHTMGTRGGWPLSMFLTADGKPVVGGTYWPREDREIEGEKVNGYKTILKMMVKVWNDKPKEIQTQADEYAEQTAAALERGIRANPILDLDRALANGAAESVREDIDPTFGGIGSRARKFVGTKFPMPTSVMAVLDYAVREKDDDLKKLVKLTLDQMLMGGIYDQLGGGFHRYSTERTWTVPHFEKMLYDNGQLVELYSEAYRQTRDPNYARVIRETLGFIQRELTSPEGGFYSALDADSNGTEGEFYVWTAEEIEKVIGDKNDVALLRAIYGVTGSPNFEKKFYILKLPRPFEEIAKEQKIEVAELTKKLDAIKKKLFDYRAKRERPFLDTKVLTAWNGQMIAGYAKAGEVLKEPEYVKAAIKNAEFLLKNLRNKDGRLMRTWGVTGEGKSAAKLNAYLDDYAFLSHGLLNLYEATGDKKWLDEAKALMDVVVKWHGDGERGGYFFTSSDHEKLFARPKDYFDGAQPSANGVVTRNLVRLWRFTKNDNYRKLAEKSFRQFAGILRSNPSGVPGMCLALHLYLDEKEAKPEKKEPKNETPTATDPLKSEDVVKLAASAGKVESGRQNIEIKLSIAKPWHIYANPSGSDGTVGNQTTVSMRIGGKPVEMMVSYPEGMLVEEKEVGYYRVYEKEVVIKAVLLRKDEGSAPLDVQVKIVACSRGDGGRCLAPSVLKSTIK